MQALVLVGGRGTRLLPLTETVPKPVLPLVDRPFLVFFLEWLADHGVDDVILACGFRPEVMEEVLTGWAGDLPALTWVVEEEPLGTAGAIRHALEHLEEEFLALNGDLLSDFDLGELVRFHREKGGRATLGLKEVDDPGPYGLVELGTGGEVTGFSEKPEDPSTLPPPPWLVNAGTYVLDRSVIEELPPDENLSIERDVFPGLAGHGLYGLGLEGYWMDIGTPDRYLQATWDVLEGRIETSVPTREDGVLIVGGDDVSPTATIGPRAVVGEGCTVAEGASVRETVLLSGASVGPKASVTGSIIGADVEVSEGEVVEGEVRGRAPVVQNRGRNGR
ncbi:MAG: sugar phosphate nucleotidyltransferase [Solirubrobacterales bacterium]